MLASQPSLLQDWELMQRRLMPALLRVAPSRSPQVWTVGRAEDAVALAVAYQHAQGNTDLADAAVFLSGIPPAPEPVQFQLADLRCLPASRRSDAFVRRERRWVPNPRVMNQVLLTVPAAPVDLVAVRIFRGRIGTAETAAMHGLRRGGHLFLTEKPETGLVDPAEFRPVGRTGRVFEKLSDPESATAVEQSRNVPPTLAEREQLSRLVESHYNLARSLARRFAHHGELSEDLEQVALLALVKAAGRYSSEHGSSFATFATASILGELKRHFRDKTWMLRVPRSLQEAYLGIKSAREELEQTLGSSPTVQQIAAHLGIPDESVLAAMEAGDSYWPASLDSPRRGDDETATDVPVTDWGFERSLNRKQLQESLPHLGHREQLIIKRLYFDGWTQRRVAEEIGVSQMQVSRLMARTLAKLREAFAAEPA